MRGQQVFLDIRVFDPKTQADTRIHLYRNVMQPMKKKKNHPYN